MPARLQIFDLLETHSLEDIQIIFILKTILLLTRGEVRKAIDASIINIITES